ncbi:MAG: spore photoproduct lyase family protein [Planctomycetota bacterium]
MFSIHPQRVYVSEEVRGLPEAARHTDEMIAAMQPDEVHEVSMAQLDEVAASGIWTPPGRWGEEPDGRDPDVVLTVARFLPPEQEDALRERYPHLGYHDMYGLYHFWRRPHGDPEWRREKRGIVCQAAWELHTVEGCPFRCAYCGRAAAMRVLVNIEEICERLPELFARAPAQRLYKWDNHSDIPCFEPEYDASRVFVERFAREEDRYLQIYVGKSADTDYLLDCDHRGHTILQWSVAGRSQTEHFENATDGMIERLDAARRLQEDGYIVRFRLSPIIPVKGWREENRELLEEMFARTEPDMVSLCPFGWMDVEEAEGCLEFDRLDPEFVEAMRGAAPFLRRRGFTNGGGHPIPHDARYEMLSFLIDEIQRISPETLIALCLETEEMWAALGERIGQGPGRYVCNCGGHCTPGDATYEAAVGRASYES